MEQQIVQIEYCDQSAVAPQFNFAQRSNFLDAAADEQGIGHGGQAAHGVRTGLLGFTQNEYADRAQITHGHAYARTDELLGYALLDGRARPIKRHAAYHDWAE